MAAVRETEAVEQTVRDLHAALADLHALARTESSDRAFFTAAMERIMSDLSAVAGAIWTVDADGSLICQQESGSLRRLLKEAPSHSSRHDEALRAAVRTGAAQTVRVELPDVAAAFPPTPHTHHRNGRNAAAYDLFVSPVLLDGMAIGAVEVLIPRAETPAVSTGCVRFLDGAAEAFADFHRRRRVNDLVQRAALWQQLAKFVREIHASADLRQTAFAVVNESRRFIDCDRVSLLVQSGGRVHVLAVSGVDVVHPRANSIRRLQDLAEAVLPTGESLWTDGVTDDLPLEVSRPLQDYLDESHARLMGLVPLRVAYASRPPTGSPALGALVIERFEGSELSPLRERTELAAEHAALALQNSLTYDRIPRPVRPLLRGVEAVKTAPRKMRILSLLTTAAVCGVVLATVPADLTITVQGELQPERRRVVYAPSDGLVAELPAAQHTHVEAGDVLVVLRRPQLDLEFKRIWGELQTTRARLDALAAMRLDESRSRTDTADRTSQLAADEEELKELLASLEHQYAILQQQQAELTIRSPIVGQILTWNVAQQLEARPVARGEALLTVGDLSGPWSLELQIPDRDVGHVLTAQEELGPELMVSFQLASQPGVTYSVRLSELGPTAEPTETEGPMIRAGAVLPNDVLATAHPGTTVTARIYCGRRPVGYVWFHGLWEAIQRYVLF